MQAELIMKDKEALTNRRDELVHLVREFKQAYTIDELSIEELDLWIERMRPIRLEMRAIDDILRR